MDKIKGSTKLCTERLTYTDSVKNLTIIATVSVIVDTWQISNIKDASISIDSKTIGSFRTTNSAMGFPTDESITIENVPFQYIPVASTGVAEFITSAKEYFKPVV